MSLSGSAFLGLPGREMDRKEQLERMVRIKERKLKVLEVQTENTTPPLRVTREIEGLKQEIESLKKTLNGE